MKKYDHKKAEKKWRKHWEKEGIYKTQDNSKKPKYYALDMFPYPSGEGLHVGHVKGYIATDIYSRFKRMNDFNVLHPMGWDAFGLPAENYAIKNKIHPKIATDKNIKRFKDQLEQIGFDYDWSREINTTDPEYYRWTQWIFLQMYKNGLAYESYEPINWCPSCKTGLANEDLDGDKCERCETKIEQKPMRQWVLKITDYADRLLNDLDELDWPEYIKESQRNWIGKNEAIKKAKGKKAITYKLKDWVFSRQRYWGEPIPLIHCDACGVVPVPEEDLPVELPQVKSYEPTGTGESPLAAIDKWVNTKCPKCGGKGKRETNTMPQWAGSSWYYLAYALGIKKLKLKNKKYLNDETIKTALDFWMPVDVYVGGAEHATRHLIYARFWHKFLNDIGIVSGGEPFAKLFNVGLIMAEDGRKMSKRWGNVINPDDIIKEWGADTLRMYEMFMGPFEQTIPWNTKNIIGVKRFLDKIWVMQKKLKTQNSKLKTATKNLKLEQLIHKTVKKVTESIESFKFNTAISALMILTNEMEKDPELEIDDWKLIIKLLAPFAPHMSEEIWQEVLGNKGSIHEEEWPKYDERKLKDSTVKIVIQIDGKVRDLMEAEADLDEEEIKVLTLKRENVKKWIVDKGIKKFIFIKNKLVNIVPENNANTHI
ncbi:TPA: leucine--tRNA ligase [Patescibacteria group bacterium]|nr:MAG: Leucyl-tRNA synthetase [Parcubacteria group bacterium GW2011_GWF2_40_10]KKR47215.1 MAG: Leucyl-tRNA synthetase [Parcubacteria group bacterium GW2011_GWA2_40_143]KKR60180.1 MAG: Leucyl-tRNA synthetase [Parcubacteria group bacterium GW2011_GWC2_40_31]HBB56936.1 leucine--tRNA ligase [Patescibacteria group bacterium]HCI04848.1 leucine--tRNA ligase [Patescibacteria group bacterium]